MGPEILALASLESLEYYECEAPYDGPLIQVSDFTTLPFTWFASGQFTLQKHSASGVRQDEVLVDLITDKDVEPGVLEEGKLSFQKWEQEKSSPFSERLYPPLSIVGVSWRPRRTHLNRDL